jgi:hypothetical protein
MALIRPPGFAWPGNGASETYARPPRRTDACSPRWVSPPDADGSLASVTMKSLLCRLRSALMEHDAATSKPEQGTLGSVKSTDDRSNKSSVFGHEPWETRRLPAFARVSCRYRVSSVPMARRTTSGSLHRHACFGRHGRCIAALVSTNRGLPWNRSRLSDISPCTSSPRRTCSHRRTPNPARSVTLSNERTPNAARGGSRSCSATPRAAACPP